MMVTLSQRALDDLDAIRRWIAIDNPERARTFVDELIDRCESLGEFPNRFPATSRLGSRARQQTCGNYVIFHEVDDIVTVTAILHAARDLDALDF